MSELTEDEREALLACLDGVCVGRIEEVVVEVERIIDARTRAVEQERNEWQRNAIELDEAAARERDRADAAEQRVAELEVLWKADMETLEATLGYLNRLEAERDDFKEKYAELNAALSWGTTCLNCSNMLTKSYEDYAKREQLEAAVLALADEWEGASQPPDEDYEGTTEGHWAFGEWLATKQNGKRLRALVSDPTVLDRARQEAVEAALAPIEALAAQKVAEAIGPNPFLLVADLASAIADARDAAKAGA